MSLRSSVNRLSRRWRQRISDASSLGELVLELTKIRILRKTEKSDDISSVLLSTVKSACLEFIDQTVLSDPTRERSIVLHHHGMEVMPDDLRAHVFSFSHLPDVFNVADTCSLLQKTIQKHRETLFRSLTVNIDEWKELFKIHEDMNHIWMNAEFLKRMSNLGWEEEGHVPIERLEQHRQFIKYYTLLIGHGTIYVGGSSKMLEMLSVNKTELFTNAPKLSISTHNPLATGCGDAFPVVKAKELILPGGANILLGHIAADRFPQVQRIAVYFHDGNMSIPWGHELVREVHLVGAALPYVSSVRENFPNLDDFTLENGSDWAERTEAFMLPPTKKLAVYSAPLHKCANIDEISRVVENMTLFFPVTLNKEEGVQRYRQYMDKLQKTVWDNMVCLDLTVCVSGFYDAEMKNAFESGVDEYGNLNPETKADLRVRVPDFLQKIVDVVFGFRCDLTRVVPPQCHISLCLWVVECVDDLDDTNFMLIGHEEKEILKTMIVKAADKNGFVLPPSWKITVEEYEDPS